MGSQSFRGAGGAGAITVQPTRTRETVGEHDLHPPAQELAAHGQRAEQALVHASTAAAVVTGLLVTTWLLSG